MIHVESLTKSYGPIEALKGVSFEVAAGEVVGLLGPNGAGKSTTIKILTGYLQPDGGTVTVDGLDVLTQPRDVQARIGYLPETPPVYTDMSVQGYLLMITDLREMPESEKIRRLSAAVYATGLENHLTRPIGQLSKGFRQRVGLAQAIIHQPKLLILDEPTVGLDPTQIAEILTLIRHLARNTTILFSSHILPQVEAVCDRVVIIMNGELKADARLDDLAQSNEAVLVLERPTPDIEATLRTLDGVETVESVSGRRPTYRVTGAAEVELCPALYQAATAHGWPVYELRRDVRTLETVFNELATATPKE